MSALRYVILRHEGIEEPHYDLMFEKPDGSGLTTWRSKQWPIEETIDVIRLRDHRAGMKSVILPHDAIQVRHRIVRPQDRRTKIPREPLELAEVPRRLAK